MIKDAPHVARETWTVKFNAKVVASFTDADLAHAVKIVGISDDLSLVAECEKTARNALGAKASGARSQPYYLDVTHPQANKGTVVATLSKLMNIPTAQIATMGDMPNDVLMFRKSGFSIAMGNAREIMLKIADDYDAMAQTALTIHRSKKALARHQKSDVVPFVPPQR